jgi:hypothetical protein
MKISVNKLILYAIIAILLFFILSGRRSGYITGRDLMTTEDPASAGSIFDLACSSDCVPGEKNGDYYTKDLSPCGKCGAQKFVNSNFNYKITGGFGDDI